MLFPFSVDFAVSFDSAREQAATDEGEEEGGGE